MRVRVSQTTLNRITKLDAPLRAERNRAAYVIAMYEGIDAVNDSEREQFTRAQRTILSWPPITACDAWGAIAAASQDALVDASYEDRVDRARRDPEPAVIGPDPADVSSRYR